MPNRNRQQRLPPTIVKCKKLRCNRNVARSSCQARTEVLPSNTVDGWPVRVQPNSIGPQYFNYWSLRYPIFMKNSRGQLVVVPRCCERCIKPLRQNTQGNQGYTTINAGNFP
jgi:hypothetical protein